GDILEVDVQRSDEVEPVDSLHIVGIVDRFPNAAGNFLIVGIAVLTGELLVEAVFKPSALVILINKADGAAAQPVERIVAHVYLFEYRSTPQPAFPEDRPVRHLLLVLVIDSFLVQDDVLSS